MRHILTEVLIVMFLGVFTVLLTRPNHQTETQQILTQVQVTKVATDKTSESAKAWAAEPNTVNLPFGEDFMYITTGTKFGYNGNVWITRNRTTVVKVGQPRIKIWKPGGHPGAWEAILYIQEH